MMAELPPTKTPFTSDELVAALRAAYRGQMGADATNHAIAMLAAHVALETGNGVACIQWNVGNFKAYAGTDSTEFTTTEYIGGKPVTMRCLFAAYQSLDEGVRSYLKSMWSHWVRAWNMGVIPGDCVGFAQGLHDQGYYTAPVSSYMHGVARWYAWYMAKLGGDSEATVPELQPIAVALPDATPDPPDAA